MPFATVVSGYTGFVKGFVDALSYPSLETPDLANRLMADFLNGLN